MDAPANQLHPARGDQLAAGRRNSGADCQPLDVIPQDERLFNLAAEVPPGFSRFASLIEVVGQGEEERVAGASAPGSTRIAATTSSMSI
jgi:hypothetical protein